MAVPSKELQFIIERCRLGIRIKYHYTMICRVEALLDAEIHLVRRLGFEEALVQIVEFCDQLWQGKVAYNLAGSGGSSVIFFLLGISEVDPVRHDTYFQRLWSTASGEPPILFFSAMSLGKRDWHDVPHSGSVSVHPMTEVEAIPARIEPKVYQVCLTQPDEQTFKLLQTGETDGIFQLDSESTRDLLVQARPRTIKGLACVTALHQISNTHPEIVHEYLLIREALILERRKSSTVAEWKLPFLYQESIMSLLRKEAGLPWETTYRFVQVAARGRMKEEHELWIPVMKRLEQRHGAKGEALFQKLLASSRWAVCRAHHVANAITSYKAAYFRTHHRKMFERTQRAMMSAK